MPAFRLGLQWVPIQKSHKRLTIRDSKPYFQWATGVEIRRGDEQKGLPFYQLVVLKGGSETRELVLELFEAKKSYWVRKLVLPKLSNSSTCTMKLFGLHTSAPRFH